MDTAKINGSFVSKEEADKMGFDYDKYEYEAEMIATSPGVMIVKGTFRVIGDMAVLLNSTKDGYFIVKIDDPLNKGIDFVEIDRHIKIASKEGVYGDTFTTGELLDAIKNEAFIDDSIIYVHTADDGSPLRLVFKCKECNHLHLVGGDDSEVIQKIMSLAEKVYFNPFTKSEPAVTRKEFVEILQSLKEQVTVSIGITSDDKIYTLSGVYKCSEDCPNIHLTCFYDEHSHNRN